MIVNLLIHVVTLVRHSVKFGMELCGFEWISNLHSTGYSLF